MAAAVVVFGVGISAAHWMSLPNKSISGDEARRSVRTEPLSIPPSGSVEVSSGSLNLNNSDRNRLLEPAGQLVIRDVDAISAVGGYTGAPVTPGYLAKKKRP